MNLQPPSLLRTTVASSYMGKGEIRMGEAKISSPMSGL